MNLRRDGVIRKAGLYTDIRITITSSLRQVFRKDLLDTLIFYRLVLFQMKSESSPWSFLIDLFVFGTAGVKKAHRCPALAAEGS